MVVHLTHWLKGPQQRTTKCPANSSAHSLIPVRKSISILFENEYEINTRGAATNQSEISSRISLAP